MLHCSPNTPFKGPPQKDRASEAAALNTRLAYHDAEVVLQMAFARMSKLALVSSFGAESVALLHLASKIRPDVPVIFIDTEMLFPETLTYQQDVAEKLGLTNVQVITGDDIPLEDPDGTLHQSDTDACCALRKTRPLEAALENYDGWITGRKRYHAGQRVQLDFFEAEPGSERIKVNPLARWTSQDVRNYMSEHDLPRHPLVALGYASIGCAPCTSPTRPGEDPRAGRWRGQTKDECGIHFVDGKLTRTGVSQ